MRTTMNISLPVPLKQWVEKQVNKKGYSTASECVRDVLRREQESEARARIDSRLTAAIQSGESTPLTSADWQRIRTEGLKQARNRRAK
jgi:antitoxin ParD1/3/4